MDYDLNHLFTYHPPTEEQKPKYEAVNDAEALYTQAVSEAAFAYGWGIDLRYRRVNSACASFVGIILDCCPDCPDRDEAIRCVRLARMLANEEITNRNSVALSEWCGNFRRARMWANAAIALAQP